MNGCYKSFISLTTALLLGGAFPASSQTDPENAEPVAAAPTIDSGPLEVEDSPAYQQFRALGRAPDVVFLQPSILLRNSRYGRQIQEEYDETRAAIARDNAEKTEALEAEEALLAELKTSGYVGPATFAILAAAFDRKVTEIREQQDAKGARLESWIESYRGWFFWFAQVALREVVAQERLGAVIGVSDAWYVAEWLDITDLLIDEVDRTLGDGEASANHIPLDLVIGQ